MEPTFAAYGHALAALAGWALLSTVIVFVASAKTQKGATSTGIPDRDYANQGYRAYRAQQNMMESAGPFIAATVAAILVGAAPFWVNLFATVFLVARVATFAVHVWTENQAARSATWLVGLVCVLALVLMAAWSAFAG